MRERPILFSAPMVRAILAGTKTQTRRVMKPQPIADARFVGGYYVPEPNLTRYSKISVEAPYVHLSCPYGQPGDRLWVRETWAYHLHAMAASNHEMAGPWVYAADGEQALQRRLCDRWRPSIHMPGCASRILLEVTSVRVERLHDISESDAMAEGCYTDPACPAYDAYRSLWQQINGPGSWDANPWVWVVEFKRVAA